MSESGDGSVSQRSVAQCEIISVDDTDSQSPVAAKPASKNAFSMQMSRSKAASAEKVEKPSKVTAKGNASAPVLKPTTSTAIEDVGVISNVTVSKAGALSGFQLLASNAALNSSKSGTTTTAADQSGMETQLLENLAFQPSFLPQKKAYQDIYKDTAPATYLPDLLELPDFPGISHTGESMNTIVHADYEDMKISMADTVVCEDAELRSQLQEPTLLPSEKIHFDGNTQYTGKEWLEVFNFLSTKGSKSMILESMSLALQSGTSTTSQYLAHALPSLQQVVKFCKEYLSTFDTRKGGKVTPSAQPEFPEHVDVHAVLQGMNSLLEGEELYTMHGSNSLDYHAFLHELPREISTSLFLHGMSSIIQPGIPPQSYCPVPGSGIVFSGACELSLSELVDIICHDSNRALLEVNMTEEYTFKAQSTLLTESTSSHRVTRSVETTNTKGQQISLWSGDNASSAKRGILGMFSGEKGGKKKKVKEPEKQVIVDLTSAETNAKSKLDTNPKIEGSVLYIDMADAQFEECTGITKVVEDVFATTHIPVFLTCSHLPPDYVLDAASSFAMYTGYPSAPTDMYVYTPSIPEPILATSFLQSNALLTTAQCNALELYRKQTYSSLHEHTTAGMRGALPNQQNRLHVIQQKKESQLSTAVVYFIGVLRFLGHVDNMSLLFQLVVNTIHEAVPFSQFLQALQRNSSSNNNSKHTQISVYPTYSNIPDHLVTPSTSVKLLTGPITCKEGIPVAIEANYDDENDYIDQYITSMVSSVTHCSPFSTISTATMYASLLKTSLPCLMTRNHPVTVQPNNVFHLTSLHSVQFDLPTLPAMSAGLPCLAKVDSSMFVTTTEEKHTAQTISMPSIVYEPVLQAHFSVPHQTVCHKQMYETVTMQEDKERTLEELHLEFSASNMGRIGVSQDIRVPAKAQTTVGRPVVQGKFNFHRPEDMPCIPILLYNPLVIDDPVLHKVPLPVSTDRQIRGVLGHRYVIKQGQKKRLLRYSSVPRTTEFARIVARVSAIMNCLDPHTRHAMARIVKMKQHATSLNAIITLEGSVSVESKQKQQATLGIADIHEAELVDILSTGAYCMQLQQDAVNPVEMHTDLMAYIPSKAVLSWLQRNQIHDPLVALYSPAYLGALLSEKKVLEFLIPHSLRSEDASLPLQHMTSSVALQLLSFNHACLLNNICFECIDQCNCAVNISTVEKEYLYIFSDHLKDAVVPEYVYSMDTYEPTTTLVCTPDVVQKINTPCSCNACINCALLSCNMQWMSVQESSYTVEYEEALEKTRNQAKLLKNKFVTHASTCKFDLCTGCVASAGNNRRIVKSMYEENEEDEEQEESSQDIEIISVVRDQLTQKEPMLCYNTPIQPIVPTSLCSEDDLEKLAFMCDYYSCSDILSNTKECANLVYGTGEYGMSRVKTCPYVSSDFTLEEPLRMTNYHYEGKEYNIDISQEQHVQLPSRTSYGYVDPGKESYTVKHGAVQYDEALVKAGFSGDIDICPPECSEEVHLYNAERELLDLLQYKKNNVKLLGTNTLLDYRKSQQLQCRDTGYMTQKQEERTQMCIYGLSQLQKKLSKQNISVYATYHNLLLPHTTRSRQLNTLFHAILSQACRRYFGVIDACIYQYTLPSILRILRVYTALHETFQLESLNNTKTLGNNRRMNSKRYTSFGSYFGSIGDIQNGIYDRCISLLTTK